MSALVTAVFKATIGLLVNKGRDKAAESLKEGDVTKQKFRGFIVREIDEIKSKLDGLAKKDLLASISFFKEGIEFLYDVFDKARSRSEQGEVTAQVAAQGTFSLAKQRMAKLDLTGLDEPASGALANAKKRFEDARRKATEAFANEALELSDRMLAMQYRVMATILETVDNPENALAACRVCIEELHQVSAVKECFKVVLEKGMTALLGKDKRGKIISTVCHVNRIIYDVTLMVSTAKAQELPCLEIREERVDPLRDERVAEVLKKQGMVHCFVNPWSFGQKGKNKHKLKNPRSITANTHEQFIIADDGDKTLKVYDSNGNFYRSFNPKTNDADTELDFLDVATDVENNTYVLVRRKKPGAEEYKREVLVYKESADPLHEFPVKRGDWVWGRLAVCSSKGRSKVLVMSKNVVDVYENEEFLCTFGEGMFKNARDITAANDGRVMVMDSGDSCVHLFTVEGQHLDKFNINIEGDDYSRMACNPAGEPVVIAGRDRATGRLRVAILTTNREFVRKIQLDKEMVLKMIGISVTMQGQIAVVVFSYDELDKFKVLVIN